MALDRFDGIRAGPVYITQFSPGGLDPGDGTLTRTGILTDPRTPQQLRGATPLPDLPFSVCARADQWADRNAMEERLRRSLPRVLDTWRDNLHIDYSKIAE